MLGKYVFICVICDCFTCVLRTQYCNLLSMEVLFGFGMFILVIIST